MQPKDAAIRKRTQIAKANRTMFLWIAISSAVVGSAVVVAIFLGQKLIFTEGVLAEKQNTISTLEANAEIIPSLETEILALDANNELSSVKASQDDQTIQVILDALPSDANSLALGASLQTKLLNGIDGLSIQSLQVDPVVGIELLQTGAVQDASATGVANQITFQFSVTGSQEAMQQVLSNLERSIRTIEITQLRIETQGGQQYMTVQARAFYEPAKTVQLYDKVIKR